MASSSDTNRVDGTANVQDYDAVKAEHHAELQIALQQHSSSGCLSLSAAKAGNDQLRMQESVLLHSVMQAVRNVDVANERTQEALTALQDARSHSLQSYKQAIQALHAHPTLLAQLRQKADDEMRLKKRSDEEELQSVASTVLSAIPMGHMSCGGVGRGSPVPRTVGLTQPRLSTVYQHHDVSKPPPAAHPMTGYMPPNAVHYQDSAGCPTYVPSASVHSNALHMLDQRTQEHSAKLKAEESEQHCRNIMNKVVPAMPVRDAVLGLQQHSHGHVYTNNTVNVGPYQSTGTLHNNRDRDQHNNRAQRAPAASGFTKSARNAKKRQAGQVLWASGTAEGDGDTNKSAEQRPEKPSSAADTDKDWRSSAATSRVFNNSSVSGEHNRRPHANAGPGAHQQGHMNMAKRR